MAFNATFNVTGSRFTTQFASSTKQIDIDFGSVIITPQKYTGELMVTPADTAQELECNGLMMPGNVTVAAIPSNYGKITYSGFELTVS